MSAMCAEGLQTATHAFLQMGSALSTSLTTSEAAGMLSGTLSMAFAQGSSQPSQILRQVYATCSSQRLSQQHCRQDRQSQFPTVPNICSTAVHSCTSWGMAISEENL